MGQHDRETDEGDLWCYVPLDRYGRPTDVPQEAVRTGLRGLWNRLRPKPAPHDALMTGQDLRAVPQQLLDEVAPPPDFGAAVPAFDEALREWLKADQPEPPVLVIVDAPHSGTSLVLHAWAKANGWRPIASPTTEQILAGDAGAFDALSTDGDTPSFVPYLEHWYLRHHDGLTLVRRLLDWLYSSRQRCIIACDSWAWAYLSRALHLDVVLPFPLTLDAFDHARLQRWFRGLSMKSGRPPFIFRQADNGRCVLPPVGAECDDGREAEVTGFTKRLAIHCRGVPGIAWAMWRHSLRCPAEDEVEEEARDAADGDRGGTIWVRPWHRLDWPAVPAATTRSDLLVLHTLLLHGGLPDPLLTELLPFATTVILRSLQRLRACGLLEEFNGRWRVTRLGYPAVRQFLRSDGYLVDAF